MLEYKIFLNDPKSENMQKIEPAKLRNYKKSLFLFNI